MSLRTTIISRMKVTITAIPRQGGGTVSFWVSQLVWENSCVLKSVASIGHFTHRAALTGMKMLRLF